MTSGFGEPLHVTFAFLREGQAAAYQIWIFQ